MKNDPYFKYVAAFILAGVVLAFVDPTPAAATLEKNHAAVTAATGATHGPPGPHNHRNQS